MSDVENLKEIYLVGLKKSALNFIINTRVFEPLPEFKIKNTYTFYRYHISETTWYEEQIQGFLEDNQKVVYFLALKTQKGDWVEETLWPNVPITRKLHLAPSEIMFEGELEV